MTKSQSKNQLISALIQAKKIFFFFSNKVFDIQINEYQKEKEREKAIELKNNNTKNKS
jgi:hypothetical protein